MRKLLSCVLSAGLAVSMLTTPALALTATPESAAYELPQSAGMPEGFTPGPLTEEEAAYDRVSPYDEEDAARLQISLWSEEGETSVFAAPTDYNKANADYVYEFLCNELGMNSAQAVGVMGNIYGESRFNPTSCNENDTGGTTSYGLCQWNSVRYDALRNWCAENGYDYTTVEGQMWYLKYELEDTYEKQVLTRVDENGLGFGNAPNTADGAWQAGYYWARYFERGASRYWTQRADMAREFWEIYGSDAGNSSTHEDATSFVTRLYEVCLDREPDASGLNNWVSQLTSGRSTGTQVAYGFVFSNEFKSKNYCNEDYVKQLYRAFLGREADSAGLADWVSKLKTGTTREEVFNGFAQSAEFKEICTNSGVKVGSPIAIPQYGTVPTGSCSVCGETDGVTAFVTRLYDICLNRKPDASGLKDWTNQLWNHTNSGRGVAYGFIFSDEFKGKNYDNSTYVEYLYKAFLGRGSDAAGKADWLNRMAQGWTREQVFDGFVGSDEFTGICQSYGIVRG